MREKCFFDQISRSENGTRGPYSNNRGQQPSHPTHVVYGAVGGMSSIAAAKRERQLNVETFGPMAARATFGSRRRPTGSVSRDFMVSASA